jgi:integrase
MTICAGCSLLALKKAGVRGVTFYQLRHSFCFWMIQSGESLLYVKDQAGHSSIKGKET